MQRADFNQLGGRTQKQKDRVPDALQQSPQLAWKSVQVLDVLQQSPQPAWKSVPRVPWSRAAPAQPQNVFSRKKTLTFGVWQGCPNLAHLLLLPTRLCFLLLLPLCVFPLSCRMETGHSLQGGAHLSSVRGLEPEE